MPYAADNRISMSSFEGGVEISLVRYTELLQAMVSGKVFEIQNGEPVLLNDEIQTIYSTETGEARVIPDNATIPDGYTTQSYPGPGSVWDNNTWTPAQPDAKTTFTPLEYLDRFTEDEQLIVVQATLVNAQVKLWYDRMLAASYVDITDPRVEGGLDALIGAGLLDAARKTDLLAPEAS